MFASLLEAYHFPHVIQNVPKMRRISIDEKTRVIGMLFDKIGQE